MKTDLTVFVEHHPLSGVGRTVHKAPAGLCLSELVELFHADIPLHHLFVRIGDAEPIPAIIESEAGEWSPWDQIRPKPEQKIFIGVKPLANTGSLTSNPYLFGAALAFAPFMLAGPLLLGAIPAIGNFLQPPTPKSPKSGNTAYTLTGSSNDAPEVGQIVPYVAGRIKFFPLRVSEPYTTTEGGQQYLHAVFGCGFGPLYFEEIGVGDTTVIIGIGSIPVIGIVPDNRVSFPGMQIEVREGRATDDPLTLYPLAVHEAGPNVELTKKEGPVIAQMLTQGVTKLWFELMWPEGLYRQKESGDNDSASTWFEIEYRKVGDSTWIKLIETTLTKETQSVFRKSWSVNVAKSTTGWEGRVTNHTSPPETNRRHNKVWWTGFQGRTHDPACRRDDQALIAVKVKASQNAQGVLNRLYCIASRYAKTWNGSAWVEQPTANPASIFRDILQNPNANDSEIFTDVQIDLAALQTWSEHNATTGRTVGLVFSDEGTGMDRLEAIASSARASVSNFDAKRGVIEDVERTIPIQAISPSNSSDFVKYDSYRRIPHALRVQFMDETHGWDRQQLIVCDDGYSIEGLPGTQVPSIFDDLDLTQTGITLPARAHEEGRMHLAESRFRRWYAVGKMNRQALFARRGELVHFSNQAFLVGLDAGYITATTVSGGNTTAIDVDRPLMMEVGTIYCVVIRSVSTSGSNQGTEILVNTVVGLQTHLTFSSAVPLSNANIKAGDMFQYGPTHLAKSDCVVKSVEAAGPGEFTVTIVPHAQPAINNAATGAMGSYNPGTTTPPGRPRAPAAPVLIFIRRGDLIVPREPFGVREIKLTAIVNLPPSKSTPTHSLVQYRELGEDDWVSAPLMSIATELTFIVPFGFIYEVQVSSITVDEGVVISSKASNILQVDAKTIQQTIVDIANVTGLELAGQGNDTNFTGRDAHFVWRMTSSAGIIELGSEPTGGESTYMDQTFLCWKVAIYSEFQEGLFTVRGPLRREEFVTQPEYYYSYDKNYSDAQLLSPNDPPAGLARSFSANVWIVDTYGRLSSNPATLVVQNPGPGLPTGLEFSANIGTIWASFNQPTDPDWQGFKLWGSAVSGFTADDTVNLIGKTNVPIGSFNTFKDGTPILPGTTYYLRLALYDAFGDDISLLTISSEYAVTTGSVDVSDLPIYTFNPVPIFTLVPGNPDVLGWTASGVTVTLPVSGVSSVYSIAAGSVPWGGQSIYISYQDGALALEASTDVGLHTHSDRTLMATWGDPGGQNVVAFNGKAGIDGSLVYARTLTGNALVVDQAIIQFAAQIASATINNAHIIDLDAAKILARSIVTQVLYLGASSGGRITLDGENSVMNVWDNQNPPRLRMQIGQLNTNDVTAWGMNLFSANGTTLIDFQGGIDGQFIKDLTVDTLKIKNGALSSAWSANQSNSFNISDSNDHNFITVTTSIRDGNPTGSPPNVIIQYEVKCSTSAGLNFANTKLYRGSTLINNISSPVSNGTRLTKLFVDETPVVGNVAYRVAINTNNQTDNFTISGGAIFVQQFMK